MFRLLSNKLFIPLFWKFSLAIIVVVLLFGSINYSIVKKNITKTVENELRNRLKFIANTLAEQLTNSILIDDYLSIQTIINTAKMNDSTIKFILLVDKNNKILVHSFENDIPNNIKFNYHCTDSCRYEDNLFNICLNFKLNAIQISRPILDGSLGYLYIGLDNKNLKTEVSENMRIYIVMILSFLIIGIIGAFVFSHLITKSIKFLEKYTANLNLSNLTKKNYEIFEDINKTNLFLKKIIILDEIDKLIDTFKAMLARLIEAHNELQRLQMELAHTEKLSTIGVLAAGLAHDINNPIAGVLNSIHRIKKNPSNIDQVNRYLELMEESAKKVQNVIKNLMDLSRKNDIEFSKVNLIDIIDKSLLLVSHMFNESGIYVNKHYEKNKYELIGSQHHLEQLFINILMNSIDAINQKAKLTNNYNSKTIEIFVSELNDSITAIVSDNGIGIEEENLKLIYQPFFTTKKNEGTGLGLSIAQNIINLHKAKIEIQSEFQSYTNVKITFKKDLYDG